MVEASGLWLEALLSLDEVQNVAAARGLEKQHAVYGKHMLESEEANVEPLGCVEVPGRSDIEPDISQITSRTGGT